MVDGMSTYRHARRSVGKNQEMYPPTGLLQVPITGSKRRGSVAAASLTADKIKARQKWKKPFEDHSNHGTAAVCRVYER